MRVLDRFRTLYEPMDLIWVRMDMLTSLHGWPISLGTQRCPWVSIFNIVFTFFPIWEGKINSPDDLAEGVCGVSRCTIWNNANSQEDDAGHNQSLRSHDESRLLFGRSSRTVQEESRVQGLYRRRHEKEQLEKPLACHALPCKRDLHGTAWTLSQGQINRVSREQDATFLL